MAGSDSSEGNGSPPQALWQKSCLRAMASLSASYAKWDGMEISDDEGEGGVPPQRPVLDVPLTLRDEDLKVGDVPSFGSVEELEAEKARVASLSDAAAAAEASANWVAKRKSPEEAFHARQSVVLDELESVASDADWRDRWRSSGERRKRVVEARLRRAPAIGAEVPLPPCAPDEYPTPLEVLWSWGEATVLFHEVVDRALATAAKPGETTLESPLWRTALGGVPRRAALDELRADLDDLDAEAEGALSYCFEAGPRQRRDVLAAKTKQAVARSWGDWCALARVRYAPLALGLPGVLEAVFDYEDTRLDEAVPDKRDQLRLSQLSVGLRFAAKQWDDVSRALFTDDGDTLGRRVTTGDLAASASAFAEMYEATFGAGQG